MSPLGVGCQVVELARTKGPLATGTDPLYLELVGPMQGSVVDGSHAARKDLVLALWGVGMGHDAWEEGVFHHDGLGLLPLLTMLPLGCVLWP